MGENILLAFQGIWNHKLRSFLTMLGIIIGIAAIITIVSTINGTNQQIKENLVGSGTNVVNVKLMQSGYEADFTYSQLPDGIIPADEKARAEMDGLDYVEETSLYRRRTWAENVFYLSTAYNGNVYGVDDHFFSVNSYNIIFGRGFVKEDHTQRRKVVILDSKTSGSLFGGADAVGQTIEIKSEPFIVIGVCAPSVVNEPVINSVQDYYMYADTTAGSIYIPIEDWDIVYRYDEPVNVAVKATGTDDMTRAGNNVSEYMNDNFVNNENLKYQSEDLLEQAAALQQLSETANTQLIWIAAISLLVGGIGVMNIMLVSVTERTREIGLKKAIGARAGRIRFQFLTEAAVLTSLGGVIGVAAGIGLAYMMSHVMGTPVSISVPACLIAVIFSMVIGIIFGIVPAFKASRLNPIDALRHE